MSIPECGVRAPYDIIICRSSVCEASIILTNISQYTYHTNDNGTFHFHALSWPHEPQTDTPGLPIRGCCSCLQPSKAWTNLLYGCMWPKLQLCPLRSFKSWSGALLLLRITDLLVFLQLRDLERSHAYEDRSSESTFRDSRSQSQDNSEPPDLPMPTCFRSRSHSYLRAIQAGCSQDDDSASVDSGCSPPPSDSTVRTYSTSTGESLLFHLTMMDSLHFAILL